MTLAEQIQLLEMVKGQLGSSKNFAADLIKAYHSNKMTPGRIEWVGKLLDRATSVKEDKPSFQLKGIEGIVALFAKAKAHLKYPKIKLEIAGKPVILAMSGASSKEPGSINVMGEGQYPNREWYGRILVTGKWMPSNTVKAADIEPLTELLMELAIDPAGVAAKYGKLTGNCCFCASKLTDIRSTTAGYGPVCAEHYGLKAQWNKATEGVLETA